MGCPASPLARCADLPVVAKPQTVVRWHRSGGRLFWRWRSRNRGGRPKKTSEVRALIRRLTQENPSWGAPKIHGEIEKLGFIVSERSVARFLRTLRRRGGSAQSWRDFLTNHRELIAAFDFFTVPMATLQLLYCFFVIEHHQRKILHCNVTAHPASEWVVQQLREAFPEAGAYRHVIFDLDDKFNAEIVNFLKDAALKPKRTSIRSPCQKAKVEAGVLLVARWILGALRKRTFFSLGELNQALAELLVRPNEWPYRKREGSRRTLFETLDRLASISTVLP